MSIRISPLDIKLDKANPRFVVSGQSDEEAIRKYMAMYEDVCQLAEGINANKGLLLGERIVVIYENNQYVVMEGNRRTTALQFLIDRNLIPDGFKHKVPTATQETLDNINNIEVDVAPDRNYAISLMSKRHIAGVKDWKPLAKKQFFASMFMNGNTIAQLNERTGISSSTIRKDIRDYKLVLAASSLYKQENPEFEEDLISYAIVPFLRIFSAKQETSDGIKRSPTEILKIKFDNEQNIQSELPEDVFKQIIKLIFKATIVDRVTTTRHTLFNVRGVESLIDSVVDNANSNSEPTGNDRNEGSSTGSGTGGGSSTGSGTGGGSSTGSGTGGGSSTGSGTGGGSSTGSGTGGGSSTGSGTGGGSSTGSGTGGGSSTGGPTPGGRGPVTFFEHISWVKLIPGNMDHDGLIVALDELYRMSRNYTRSSGRSEKIYCAYPVGAGMLLRTAYEQALILQLKKIGLWNTLKSQFNFPMLSNIEAFIQNNINRVLPESAMRRAFGRIISANSRDFLNSNIHNPGLIRTNSSSLEGLANGGMLSLIQLIIDNI